MYKKEKKGVYHNALELQNGFLGIYFFEYEALSETEKRKLGNKYCPANLFIETYSYDDWCKNNEEYADLSSIPPLEDEKKVPLKGY